MNNMNGHAVEENGRHGQPRGRGSDDDDHHHHHDDDDDEDTDEDTDEDEEDEENDEKDEEDEEDANNKVETARRHHALVAEVAIMRDFLVSIGDAQRTARSDAVRRCKLNTSASPRVESAWFQLLQSEALSSPWFQLPTCTPTSRRSSSRSASRVPPRETRRGSGQSSATKNSR